MTITVNGKAFTVSLKRLRWQDIAALAGKRPTNLLKMTYTVPGKKDVKAFNFGTRLIVVDGMALTVK